MSKSEQNLKDAFAGESQANRKYLAFAKKAESEGFIQAARMFRAAAEAETIHAHNHLRALGGIHATADNLREAIAGETFEFKSMYPDMIRAAEEEGNAAALRSFRLANDVEKVHAELYTKVLDSMAAPGEPFDYWVCSVCGHTVERNAPERCEICGVAASAFFRVE